MAHISEELLQNMFIFSRGNRTANLCHVENFRLYLKPVLQMLLLLVSSVELPQVSDIDKTEELNSIT